MSEPVELHEVTVERTTPEPIIRLMDANRRGLDLTFGAQRLMLEEALFVANEVLDRARTETHLFAEFISKLAGSHSVKDIGAMWRECGQHQLDFIRRDCDRVFRHGERVIEITSGLVNDRPRRISVGATMTPQSRTHQN